MAKDQDQTAVRRKAYPQGTDLGGVGSRHRHSETNCGQIGREADDCTHDVISTAEGREDQGHWKGCREREHLGSCQIKT